MHLPDRSNIARTLKPKIRTGWLPLLVGALLSALVFVLWETLDIKEHSDLHNKLKSETEFLAENIEADLRNRIPSLQRIVRNWELHRGTSRDDFISQARSYLSDVPGFQALEWVDEKYYVRLVVPYEGNEKAQNLFLAFEKNRRNAMEKASIVRSPVVTTPIDLVQGGKGFLIFFPVYINGVSKGYILAVVRIKEWLDYVFKVKNRNRSVSEYKISVNFDDETVYQQEGWEKLQDFGNISSVSILLDHKLYVHIRPTEEFISSSESMLPELTALFGILMSFLVALVVRLFQNAYSEAWRTSIAKSNLEAEISERERIELELKQNLVHMDMAAKAGHLGLWTWNLSTDIMKCNEYMFELFDISTDIVVTFDIWRDKVHPDDRETTEKLLVETVKGRAKFDTSYRIILPGCGDKIIRSAARVIRGSDNEPQYVTGLNWDITESRNAELALRNSEEKVRLLLDSTSEAIYGIDLEGICTFANPACARILGYTGPEMLMGKNMHMLIHHSHQDGSPMPVETCRIYMAIREGKEVHVDDEVLWRADGTSFPAEYWSSPQFTSGVASGAVITFNDITERKKAGELLATERMRLAYILEGTNAGTWEWNIRTGELVINERWADIIGYTLEELSPVSIDTWVRFVYSEDLPVSNRELEKHFSGEKEFYDIELRMVHKNGDIIWIHDRGRVFERDVSGNPVKMAGTHSDITDKKEAEARILIAKIMAEDANKAKSTFLANMSHDLRTPMNAIIGISGVLVKKYDNTNARFKEGLQLIYESGERLLNLINDLLDLSRIEAQRMDISSSWFALKNFVSDIDRTMSVLLKDKNVFFEIISGDTEQYLYYDKDKLYRILFNLLGNAVKFTNDGSIILKLIIDNEKSVFEVIDTGIGITESQLQYVFEPFYQADDSMTREYTGSGLGLALCKSMAELMKGIIEIESEPGKGTIARLILPGVSAENVYNQSDGKEKMVSGHTVKHGSENKRILVIDDEYLSRETFRHMLENNYKLTIAGNGVEAIEILKKEMFDVVLLDIIMPSMDGYEVIEEIHSIYESIPVIAVTARAMAEDKKRILEHGFATVITKPLNQDELIDIIESL